MAKKGINNKHHILLDGKGYIVKPYSPKIGPDSTFINRYGGGDPDLIGQPRIPKWFQDDWSHGQGQEFFEDSQMFEESFGIDITDFSKLKLANKFNAATYDGGNGDWVKPVRFDGKFWSANGTKFFTSADGLSWSDTGYTAANTITDLEPFKNKLYAAKAGSSGNNLLEHTAGTAVEEWSVVADSELCTYLRRWDDYLYIVATNIVKSYDDSDFVTIKDFTGATDEDYLFKKPKPFAQILYIPCNVDSDTGPSKLWHYDQENLFEVYESEDPMGDEIIIYDNRLVFVTIGDKYVDFWAWNGSSASFLFYLDQPSNAYTNITFTKTDTRLHAILDQAGTPNKYLLVYDTAGWSFQSALPTTAAINWKLGVFDKRIYAFGSNGNIYQLSNSAYDASGELITSWFDINLLDLKKILANFTSNLEALPANTSVTIYYRKDDSVWAELVVEDTDGAFQAVAGFPIASNTVSGVKIQLKIKLISSNGVNTPVVKDTVLGFVLAPETRRSFDYVIVATKKMRLLDGTEEPRTPEQILNDLWTSKRTGNIIELANKYGVFNVLFSDSTPSINDPHPGEPDMESLITVRFYVIRE